MSNYVADKIEQAIRGIEGREPDLHAWETLFADAARERAAALDRDANPGPLHGLTVGVKDIFDIQGHVCGHGLSFELTPVASCHSTVVERMLAAGAVIVGTTKLTEYCYFRPTDTLNPHHPNHTPGGSSSGSAAAVGAGLVDIAIGTQTIGSIIRPASFCGVYGFKPTLGAISTVGASALSRSMDHVGLFARTAGTLSALYEVLAVPDPRDPLSRPIPPAPEAPLRRIGLVDMADQTELSADMEQALAAYADNLAAAGWQIEPVQLPFSLEDVRAWSNDLLAPEVYANLRHILDTPDYLKLGPELRELVETGRQRTLADYFSAREQRARCMAQFDALFDSVDCLLLPSAPGAAPAGLASTGDPICTVVTSLTGTPAANIPIGKTDEGLPLGAQLIARRFDDRRLLDLVAALEPKA